MTLLPVIWMPPPSSGTPRSATSQDALRAAACRARRCATVDEPVPSPPDSRRCPLRRAIERRGRQRRAGADGRRPRHAATRARRRAGSAASRRERPSRLRSGPDAAQTPIATGSASAAAPPASRVRPARVARATRQSTAATTAATETQREQADPAGARVAARPERVDERDRPRRVREPVHEPPGAVADPRAQQARHDQREQQVEGDGAEAEPDRPVRARRTG